jgi:RNA polymerase sigma-70 factor, ECF subfamily
MDLDPDTTPAEIAWLGPYPDAGLSAEQREAVELAFVAALQHLPGNQRAALLLFEVLGFSAAEIAAIMDTTAASVNSALQRARATVADKVPSRAGQPALRKAADARLRATVAEFAGALERGDSDGLVALLTKDVTWSMPPLTEWYTGLDPVMEFARRTPLASCGDWQHVPVSANGRPAVAGYLRAPGSDGFAFWSVNVFGFDGDRIASITSFIGDEHAEAFGLPLRRS